MSLLGHSAVGPLLQRAGLVDRYISRDEPAADALFAPGPEQALRLIGPLDQAVVWSASAPPSLLGNLRALGVERPLVAPSQPAVDSPLHVAEHLMATLEPLGVDGDALEWPGLTPLLFDVPPAANADRPALIVVHPGSGSWRKNWPPERFAAATGRLAEQFGAEVLLVSGPADAAATAAFMAASRRPVRPLLESTLLELARQLARCSLYLGNDSGVSHLAGLCGAPTLALFGPTHPARWRPLGRRVRVLWRQPLDSLEVETVVAEGLRLAGGPGGS